MDLPDNNYQFGIRNRSLMCQKPLKRLKKASGETPVVQLIAGETPAVLFVQPSGL